MTFSVVICAYTEERWEDLSAAVASVRDQRLRADETIVVTDHNPRLAARARAAMPDVVVVENDGQRGLSDARNRGVRAAGAGVVAFLDDDARADPGWLATLAAAYDDARVMGAGGSAIPVWRSGARPGWFPNEFDWVVGCSYRGMPAGRAPVRNFLGCNMSFRREVFERIGGFDPSVGRVGIRPVGGEETEFCIRVQRAYPLAVLLYEPAAVVHHAVPRVRATWSYFRSRCYSEGISKATVSRLAGAGAGLSSERRYVVATLPLGVLRHARAAVTARRSDGIRRAAAIIGGLMMTTAGYAVGATRHAVNDRTRRSRAVDP